MAYDRYDTRDAPRDDRSRWSGDDRYSGRGPSGQGGRGERGFFERAGDEIASWFGDDDADRRRRHDETRDQRPGDNDRNWRGNERSWQHDRARSDHRDQASYRNDQPGFHDRDWEHGQGRGYATSERDYNPSWQRGFPAGDRNRDRNDDRGAGQNYGGRERGQNDRGYRPMTGDYGRSSHESGQFFAASGVGRGERGFGDYSRDDDGQSEWGRDPYRSTSRAGTSDWTDRSRHEDPHYDSWRQRHMSELDRDYDDYRRENQSRFEDDFAGWRERRQQKRGLLGQIREHMEVIGNDKKHVGTIDKTAGDRIILTKSDPESGGVHHSISCSDIDRVEDDRIILDCSADEAKRRWRDESRNRALFERDDQGEMGPHVLDRSFEGTYRR